MVVYVALVAHVAMIFDAFDETVIILALKKRWSPFSVALQMHQLGDPSMMQMPLESCHWPSDVGQSTIDL